MMNGLRRTLEFGALAFVAIVATPALGQPVVLTYEFEGVLFSPDITFPGTTSVSPMTGSFEWTYEEGDFENGSGVVLAFDPPYTTFGPGSLIFTVETGGLEASLDGNFQNLGMDVSMFFLEPLSPDSPSEIDPVRSHFDIQHSVLRSGHIVAGRVMPVLAPACPADFDGDGAVGAGDLAMMLSAWGGAGGDADLDGDGVVGAGDLAVLLSAWGVCD